MPITPTAFPQDALQAAIYQAFKTQMNNAASADGDSSEANLQQLSNDIAAAVNSFVVGCIVTINPGQVVSAAGTPGVVIGSTISPGTS